MSGQRHGHDPQVVAVVEVRGGARLARCADRERADREHGKKIVHEWKLAPGAFSVADQLLQKIKAKVILVDIHAEATSEKISLGWYLDGRVTAVVGTHTHVQTADDRILPKGTAYLTDVGMTGPHDSIIGVEIQAALGRFLTALPSRFETATENPRLNAVIDEADEQTGRATDIERLSLSADDIQQLADLADDRPVRSSV